MAMVDNRFKDRVVTLVELLYVNSAAISRLTLDSRSVAFNETVQTLVTEGTTVAYEKDFVDRFSVTMENQVFQEALNHVFFNIAGTTSTATAGLAALTPAVARRDFYDGAYASGNFGLCITYECTNIDTGARAEFQITFPKCQVRRYNPNDGAQRRAIPIQRTELTAIKTTTDLLGVTLVGLPDGNTTGVYYVEDRLA